MGRKDVDIHINGKDNFSQAANSAGRSANNLKGMLGGLNIGSLGGLGSMLSVAGLGAMAAGSIKLAASYEQTTVAFKTMLKSGSLATDLLGKLNKFAQETPFQFTELTDASKKLLAFGVSAEQIVPTLRRLGDVSAGIGAPIGEIAELYGKAKVQGRLFAEDVNQFTGRGIPLIQELAKQFGTTDSAVRGLVESGQVGFKNLEQAFISLSGQGGQFSGMMVEQSKTLIGQWSSLKDLMEQVGRTIAEKVLPQLKDAVGAAQWLLGGGIGGVPGMAGNPDGLAGSLSGGMLTAGRNIGNQRDAIAAGKRAIANEKDPKRRAMLQAQVDAMEQKNAALKGDFANGMATSNAFRARIGAGVSGAVGGVAGMGGAIGDLFGGVKRGFGEGGDKLGLFKEAFKLMEAEQGPQSAFKRRMAEIEKNPFLDQRMKDQEIQKAKNKLNDELRGGMAPDRGDDPFAKSQQERSRLAPLTEARFLTSAPGYAADPATKAAQENATVSKEQLVVLRAMERKMQRQARLGVL